MKSEVHDKGLWHSAIHLWIYNSKGEVLLQKRDAKKLIWPDLWDISVAGHMQAGEAKEAAVLKEAEEELGLKIGPEEIKYIGVTKAELPIPPDGWLHRAFNWTYALKRDLDTKNLKLEVGETSEVRWLSLDKFEEEINDPVKLNQFPNRSKTIWEFAISHLRELIGKNAK